MKLLMCRPDYYGIEYEINPWMNIEHHVLQEKALTQWQNLYETLKRCGADISLIPPAKGWPDMVFTANAGLFYQQKIILPHFKYKERQGELPYFQAWFMQAGFTLENYPVLPDSPFFEGAGDALPAGDALFAGYGFRTERKFYEQAAYLNLNKLVYCELRDPYFYHIDTCFCPLTQDLAMWYPNAFAQESRERMKKEIELIPVVEAEAKRFACNAVVLNKQIVLPTGCPKISAELEKRGFNIYACDMDEYLKAGGACKCLTLCLD